MANSKNNTEKFEIAPINPGWIKRKVPDSYADDDLRRIVLFYVINTPCVALSSSGIPLTEYGWKKDVWKTGKLKEMLFSVASLKKNSTFFLVKKLDEIKNACERANMKKAFHKNRDVEKIVIYKPNNYNEFTAVLYHIRNALAHGRLAMYESFDGIVFVLEDGVKKGDHFYVRSRMILKKSTLLKWIDILECKTEEAKDLCQH